MEKKQTYSKKEYFKLFDDMDKKHIELKKEIEKLNQDKIKLKETLKFERERVLLLQKKISEMTGEFLTLSNRFAI